MGTASPGATLLAVGIVHFLMPFMMSAVGVALPALGREMGASAFELGLVETTYVTSAAVFLLAMGRLGDLRGRRLVFRWGLVVFTAVGGLLALAPSIRAVIALRFLQGLGGAMVNATGLAIVTTSFPPRERGHALGITVACVYLGISCGPLLGGLLVDALGWRSIFALGFALGTATFGLVSRRLGGEEPANRGEPFDWRGSLLYGAAILALVTGASHLKAGAPAVALAAAGTGGLVLFLVLEAKTEHPLLDVRLLRENRLFALSNLAALLNYASTFGVTFFLSLYLQYVKGLSPRGAGVLLFVQPLTQAALSPLCGRLADRYAPEKVASAGMALCAAALALTTTISASTPLGALVPMLALLGTGFALFSSPNTSAIMGSVPPRFYGLASGMVASMRTLGMMASMTVITVIFSLLMGGHAVTLQTQPAFLRSMRLALLIFCLLSAAGILLSLGRLGLSTPARSPSAPGEGG